MANNNVIATEVESMILVSSDRREKRNLIAWALPGKCASLVTAGYSLPYLLRCGAGMKPVSEMEISGSTSPLSGTVMRRSRNLRFSGSARS